MHILVAIYEFMQIKTHKFRHMQTCQSNYILMNLYLRYLKYIERFVGWKFFPNLGTKI